MSNEKQAIINKRLLTITVVLAAIAAVTATGLLVNILSTGRKRRRLSTRRWN